MLTIQILPFCHFFQSQGNPESDPRWTVSSSSQVSILYQACGYVLWVYARICETSV